MSSWTLTAAGFDGGNAEEKRENDGKDEKAEKITHKRSCCQMKGRRDAGFRVDGGEELKGS